MTRALLAIAIISLLAPAALADVFVYPKNNQSQEKQQQDEYQCYQWAKAQSGVDPARASQPAPNQIGDNAAGTARGGLRGAAAGAVLGEIISDDAGKGAAAGAVLGGMRGRRQSIAGKDQAQKDSLDSYTKAYSVCLEARGYAVK